MTSKIVENLRRRAIKTFMDMLILAELLNKPLSGYDIIGLIHKRFNVLVSSGTVYSLLYLLERKDYSFLVAYSNNNSFCEKNCIKRFL